VRIALLLILATTLFSGCAADATEEETPEAADSAILNGTVESGYPAVGMLRFRSGSFGSASLIDPRWVLTAGHVGEGSVVTFFYGRPAAGKAPVPANLKSVAVDRVVFHPCWPHAGRAVAKGCPSDPVDVALVHLAAPITDVAPLPVIDSSLEYLGGFLSPYEGDRCTAVGFGYFLDAAGKATAGTRRSATSFIKTVGDDELTTERDTGIATSGDSGGPLLCGGKIVGTVRGNGGAAVKGSPFERILEAYERVDLRRDWIKTTVKGT
jgi:hypothetical protein